MIGVVRFEVLGPMRIYIGTREILVTSARDRILLAALLLHAGSPVPVATLVDAIWGGRPPRDPRNQVQGCVWRLRKLLGGTTSSREIISTDPAGYRIAITPEGLDLAAFRRMRTDARSAAAAGRTSEANERYRAALALWRGPALVGIGGCGVVRSASARLDEERLQALEECIEIELARGKASELIPELTELVRQHPYREKLHGALMLALYRAGRQADSLAAYQHARQLVHDELGIEPSGDLQALHRAILNRDTALDAQRQQVPSGSVTVAFRPATPRMLPPDISDFTGRKTEIGALSTHLAYSSGEATPVAIITGPAGVGKTALSVHIAHRLRSTYPDGQLHMNLRGFDEERPADPVEALGRFLRSLGVDGTTLEGSLDERVELYRNLLADRRVLVVLDNAATEDQVLPLVPGGPPCGVIVNSRAPLGSALGAEALRLEPLDEPSSAALVGHIVGTERAKAEPDAVIELARLCGHLPLALRVAAGKLAAKPHWSIESLAHQLRDERSRLDHLSRGALDVRASISLSYAGVSTAAKRLLCRLSDADVATVASWMPAAVLDTSLEHSAQVTEELFDAQLIDAVDHHGIGQTRYRIHDLVRLYAKERGQIDESPDALAAARARALGAWLFIADRMYECLEGGDDYETVHGAAPRRVVDPELTAELTSDPQAWFDAERWNLIAMVRKARAEGLNDACWDLASTTSPLFRMRRCFDDWPLALQPALEAAKQSAERLGVAVITYRLAEYYTNRQDFSRAWDGFEEAARLFAGLGNDYGRAVSVAQLAMVDRFRGYHEQALRYYQEALNGLQQSADKAGVARVLRSIGQIHLDRGEEGSAETFFIRSLALYREADARRGEAQVRFWLGMLRMQQEHYTEARRLFTKALAYSRELRDRSGEIQALRGLGLSYQRVGDLDLAKTTLTEALRLAVQPRPTLLEGHVRGALEGLSST